MTCLSPRKGYRGKYLTDSGKRKIVYSPNQAICTSPLFQVTTSCKQCGPCRAKHARNWAIRCMCEAYMHRHNSFITLTYSEKFLPKHGSLVKKHFQDFIKRLRSHFVYERLQELLAKPFSHKVSRKVLKDYAKATCTKIRYYYGGEYGSQFKRPHFHAIIFGYDFPDKKHYKFNRGNPLCRSELLEKCWKFGYSSVGKLTFASANYVARYCMKKVTGDIAFDHYAVLDPANGMPLYDALSGEFITRLPEYNDQSDNIGLSWLQKYKTDVYPSDEIQFNNGLKFTPPPSFDRWFEVQDPNAFSEIKKRRIKNAKKFEEDLTPERLEVKRKSFQLRQDRFPRELDKILS